MRIGQLSELTGTSRRLLRYYEEQGLIASQRYPNGYRDYDERLVDRVRQIRGLLDAGLPTRIIKQLLPCLDTPRAVVVSEATPETIAILERELDRMTRRINCLASNRDAIAEYLDAVRGNVAHRGYRVRSGTVGLAVLSRGDGAGDAGPASGGGVDVGVATEG